MTQARQIRLPNVTAPRCMQTSDAPRDPHSSALHTRTSEVGQHVREQNLDELPLNADHPAHHLVSEEWFQHDIMHSISQQGGGHHRDGTHVCLPEHQRLEHPAHEVREEEYVKDGRLDRCPGDGAVRRILSLLSARAAEEEVKSDQQ